MAFARKPPMSVLGQIQTSETAGMPTGLPQNRFAKQLAPCSMGIAR